jgi:hypothetical protein
LSIRSQMKAEVVGVDAVCYDGVVVYIGVCVDVEDDDNIVVAMSISVVASIEFFASVGSTDVAVPVAGGERTAEGSCYRALRWCLLLR